ncbi:MAG TPA: GDP-mannose 4,6-dehydratase [Candidatus Saccharimonadales bacterium]|nr:GDP-mannose 4,6-dehydratase [Candidatus Saccharimonadales bacterium]
MKKALITGIAGFAGSHLTKYLLEKNIDIYGFYHPDHPTDNLDSIKDRINLVACDVLDAKKVESEIKKIKPDYVFHLAAFSSPAQSFIDPASTLQNNILCQLSILESIAKNDIDARILVVGSADEYGNIDEKYLPVGEETPLAPNSPYAVSKVTQDMLGLQFFLHKKMKIVRVRPFNHIGPAQAPVFVVPAFASQIAQLEKNGGGTLKVGNLETYRDFTDVRDIVKAYLLALDKGEFGEVYNLGSGKSVRIKDVLDKLLSHSKVKIKVEIDKSLLRPVDIKKISCDFSKFQKKTGWQPSIPLEVTLSDTIEYERKKLQK